jgi:hypothetical protein
MRHKTKTLAVFTVALLCFAGAPVTPWAVHLAAAQTPAASKAKAPKKTKAAEAFLERVKNYVKLREDIEGKAPNRGDDATPEQIEAHKKAFQEMVRSARAGAKHGDVFTPDIAKEIRAAIKSEFKGKERVELRETVLVEAENKAVPLRVNYPYPETQEQLDMPPTLLLKLPQLPRQVRYRFVRRNLLLVDRENGLIIDYMTNALP